MTTPPVDFPDWSPPATRVASVVIDHLTGTLATGNTFINTFDSVQVQDLLIARGFVSELQSITAAPLIDGADFVPVGQTVAGAGLGAFAWVPVPHHGQGAQVVLANASGADWDYAVDILSYSGAQVDQVMQAATADVYTGVNVPNGGDSDALTVPQVGLYDRVQVTAQCDQVVSLALHKVAVLVDGVFAPVTFDVQLGALAAGVAQTFDVPAGASGAAVVASNAGGVDGTLDVFARAYRAAGV